MVLWAYTTHIMNSQKNKTLNRQVNNNLIEQLKGLQGDVTNSLKDDVLGGISHDLLSSLFGTPTSGDMLPNQPINLDQQSSRKSQEQPAVKQRKPEIMRSPIQNEILHLYKQEQAQAAQQINEIRFELKAMIAAINNINREIEMAVKQEVIDPGIYYLSFLDRLKNILKVIRKNLNDSATWLSCMRSRRKERKYWHVYKKKGTQFGLSSERSTATQTS